MSKRVAKYAGILSLAVILPALSFAAIVVPYDRFPGPERFQNALTPLDYPVAIANRFIPDSWRTHVVLHLPCDHTYCFPDRPSVEAARFLSVGTPAYLALFMLPAGIGRLVRRRRARR